MYSENIPLDVIIKIIDIVSKSGLGWYDSNRYETIINLGQTCKLFHKLVENILWKPRLQWVLRMFDGMNNLTRIKITCKDSNNQLQ